MEWLAAVFSLVCGQNPTHTWAPAGVILPCCQRCTGLYTGAALAVLLQLLLQPRLTDRFLQLHGLFLLQMVPFGFHWLPQGPLVRTLTGLLFGFGVVAFLFCLPRARRCASQGHCAAGENSKTDQKTVVEVSRSPKASQTSEQPRQGEAFGVRELAPAFSRPGPSQSAGEPAHSKRFAPLPAPRSASETASRPRQDVIYWCALGGTLLLLPAWASWGGPLLARALGVFCFAGLLALAALVVVNLGLTLAWAARRLGWRRIS